MHKHSILTMRAIACLSTFTFGGAQAMMIALYPALAWALHLDLSIVLLSFSVGSFLFLFGSPFWSNTSDFLGRHSVLKIGNAALLLSFAMMVFLVNYPVSNLTLKISLLLISQMLYGLVASATVPAAQALHVDLAAKSSSVKTMLIHSMSLSLGRVVGYALVAMFYGKFQKELSIYLIYMLSVFLIIVFYRVTLPEHTKTNLPRTSWKAEIVQVRWIIVIAFLFACFLETLIYSLGGIVEKQFLYDSMFSSGVSAHILLLMSIGIFMIEASGNTLLKESWRAGLFLGVVALLLGSITLAAASSITHIWIAMGFCVVGIGLMPSCYLSRLRKDTATHSYGKRAGIIAASHTLGYTLGGVFSAILFNINSQYIGFVLAIIAVCLGLACVKQTRFKVNAYRLETL